MGARWFAQCMIRAGLSDDSRRMIRAKTGMIRALMVMFRTSEIFYNVFVELFVNYTIIQLLFILFFYFLTTFCNVHHCLDHLSVFDTVCKWQWQKTYFAINFVLSALYLVMCSILCFLYVSMIVQSYIITRRIKLFN